MSVRLNHTIVLCRDRERSAAFFTEVFGLPPATAFGPFRVVELANELSLDFHATDERDQRRSTTRSSSATTSGTRSSTASSPADSTTGPIPCRVAAWPGQRPRRRQGRVLRRSRRALPRDHHPPLRQRFVAPRRARYGGVRRTGTAGENHRRIRSSPANPNPGGGRGAPSHGRASEDRRGRAVHVHAGRGRGAGRLGRRRHQGRARGHGRRPARPARSGTGELLAAGSFQPIMEHPNRGKRSIGLALEHPGGLEVLLRPRPRRATCSSPTSCPTRAARLQHRRRRHPRGQPGDHLRARERPSGRGARRRRRAATTLDAFWCRGGSARSA